MQIKNNILFQILLLIQIIKEILSYNDSIPFNWTKIPDICYEEDFAVTDLNRPYFEETFPKRGCDSDERNRLYAQKGQDFGLTNITYEPPLDFFFLKTRFPPLRKDPPTSMTFRLTNRCSDFHLYFTDSNPQTLRIYFGRSDDYLPVPEISKKTFEEIKYNGKKAILYSKVKIEKDQLLNKGDDYEFDFSKNDYKINEFEGEEFNSYFDGYELDFSEIKNTNCYTKISSEANFCQNPTDVYAIIIKVYDTPRMKVQGLFQYNYSALSSDLKVQKSFIYTVDTRNIFFQNISMFYNQQVNTTKNGTDPVGEDSGFWINTTCNMPSVATIMVDYFFFETIAKMEYYGYEFSDRFKLIIHTPFYRKTLNKRYSLFRNQWNSSYPKPQVFIHPIYKYHEYCISHDDCPNMFNYTLWSEDPKFTQYIIYIPHEIDENKIIINFSELEKIRDADGFNRSKLSINVNNTMAPHISQVTNGLWAELVDTVTNDWVMKTKTSMDEVYGYSGDDEPDPYRNFYLTCEIPDNITTDDVQMKVKKYAILSTAHIWIRLDTFNKGITKLYPPRFNFVITLPPQLKVNNRTFIYTYQYYRFPGTKEENYHFLLKDLRERPNDGVITNETFDFYHNMINISELHPNYPNGDDTKFFTQTRDFFCNYNYDFIPQGECLKLEYQRQYLYYFYNLDIGFAKNNTYPFDMKVYYINYVPHRSKSEVNLGLHRWNQNHAGWKIPSEALYLDPDTNKHSYRYYYEPDDDNFFQRSKSTGLFENKVGSSGIEKYDGPDCVFNFAGGSTMRNKSCEFWVGLIPDKPFTNYARDIYEEHLAFRTLNDESPFWFETHEDIKAEMMIFTILEPYPGKFTGLTFQLMFILTIKDALIDGEPKCGEFFIEPPECEGVKEAYKPITNIYSRTRDFFIKIILPEGIRINSTLIGNVLPCFWDAKSRSEFNNNTSTDYLCFYWNETVIYAFNSTAQWGFVLGSGHWDIAMQVDGLYINETYTEIKKESGKIEFGFFYTTFFYSYFPALDRDDNLLYIKNNYTFSFEQTNPLNDAENIVIININAKNNFDIDTVFRIDFGNDIPSSEIISVSYNRFQSSKENLDNLKENNYFSKNSLIHSEKWKWLGIPDYTEKPNSFIFYPYYE